MSPRLTILLFSAAILTGCQTASYYSQAIQGQWEIVRKQTPNTKVIADPATPEPLREQLTLAARITAFAESDLLLPSGGNYTRYADVKREYVLWNVFAAPEFSLEPRRWWYPFIGRFSYRGYFQESMAEALGQDLEAEGYDVYVGGVDAYSTLGWFRDPVLNTFVNNKERELAELIFHELAHRKLYFSESSKLSESFAVAVEEEGVRRWLKARGDEAALKEYETQLDRRRQVYGLIMETRDALEALYDTDLPEEVKRSRKAQAFAELKQRYSALRQSWPGDAPRAEWFDLDLNNAHLNAVATYFDMVPYFTEMLRKEGGDLERFYEAAKDAKEEDGPS